MQGNGSKVDWEAVQRERHEGKSVSELSEKYGISYASIYTRTRGNGTRRPAGGYSNKKTDGAALATAAAPVVALPERPKRCRRRCPSCA